MSPIIQAAQLGSSALSEVLKRDVNSDVKSNLTPNDTQKVTLAVAAAYVVIIGILWHVPILKEILYPLKLLTVGMHEMCHALAGVLTCGRVMSIHLDPDEGGVTKMRGGVPFITLPAGYLGSCFIGACLITCGFDTNASKIACIDLGIMFLLTLWWARRSWVAWATILLTAALIVLFWMIPHSVALRFFVLFVGVMSCLYCIWDIIDDTLKRKINSSDASQFGKVVGFGGSRFWGFIWLIIACCFFAAAILVGIAVFKDDWATQREKSDKFLAPPAW